MDAVITLDKEIYNVTYGDAAFTLNVKDNNPEADVIYSSSNEDVATVLNGTVTIKGAGKATITVSLAETTNYNTVETKVDLTVNKAKNTPNMPDRTMSVPYSTSTVGEVTLPGDWAWQDSDKTVELKVGVEVKATAVYTGSDAGNYENESIKVSITRQACTHTGGTATCSHKAVCTVCGNEYGEPDKTNHAGETEVRDAKEATCAEEGYTGDTYCKDCGEKTATGTTIAAFGHNYTSEVTKESTTTEEGVRTYTCTICGDSYTEVIPKLPTEDHEHSYTAQVTKEPTATEPGVRTYTCSCGDSYTEVIPKLPTENPKTEQPTTENPTTEDPKTEQPTTETPTTEQSSQTAAEETQILEQKTDKDIKGSSFRKLCLRMSKVKKNSITLKWNKVKGADGYIVYGNRCNSKGKIYKMEKLSDTKKLSYTHKKLKKGTYYKYIVRAYKLVDGVKTTVATSKTLHITTSGGKYGNYTSVKVPKTKVTIKKGRKYTIKAKAVTMKGKKAKVYKKLAYETSNKNIATVTSKGVVKAKKKGSCYIYVYAQNGVYKKIKVTVK